MVHQGNTHFHLSKSFFTTQLLEFKIKTCQDNSEGVKSCSYYFNFGSPDTAHGSTDNFLSGYSKNWKISAKSDDFTVLDFITMFPFQKKHNQKTIKHTWLIPKTTTSFWDLENFLNVKFSFSFMSKSSCSNIMVFKQELQCYSVFSRNQVFFLKRLTTWKTSNYHRTKHFFAEMFHKCPTYQCF